MKKLFIPIFIFLMLFQTLLYCEDFSGDVYMAGVSKYLWRGQELYRKGALQPGLNVNYKKLSIGLWSSFNLADNIGSAKQAYGEADVTVSFADNFKKLGYSAGYTYYTFPSPVEAPSLSSEYFLGLSLDVLLSPGITMYYDVAQGNGTYFDFALSLPFTLGVDFSLDANAGYNAGQWGYVPSPTVFGLNLSSTYSIGKIDLTPGLYIQSALDKQYKYGKKDIDGYVSFNLTYNL